MPDPTIVFAPVLDEEVRGIADSLLPAGFTLRNVETSEIASAIQDADYLCGFIGNISTEAMVSAAANRLKLIQLMSAGYESINLEGARAARLPVSDNGGANAIAVAEHAIMMMLSALKHAHS